MEVAKEGSDQFPSINPIQSIKINKPISSRGLYGAMGKRGRAGRAGESMLFLTSIYD